MAAQHIPQAVPLRFQVHAFLLSHSQPLQRPVPLSLFFIRKTLLFRAGQQVKPPDDPFRLPFQGFFFYGDHIPVA